MTNEQTATMESRIAILFDRMTADYRQWTEAMAKHYPHMTPDYVDQHVNAYKSKLSYEVGKKYIRIVSDGGAYGFIVIDAQHPKFKLGDMLKADSWKTPALNFKRGNIFEDSYTVKWTGIS